MITVVLTSERPSTAQITGFLRAFSGSVEASRGDDRFQPDSNLRIERVCGTVRRS
jgi:hypothetical protein